jgi:hypothetical protein
MMITVTDEQDYIFDYDYETFVEELMETYPTLQDYCLQLISGEEDSNESLDIVTEYLKYEFSELYTESIDWYEVADKLSHYI